MRTLLIAVAAFGLSCEARAVDVLAGGPAVDFGIYSVSASAPEVVGVTSSGNNLLATTLTVTNTTGDSDFDITGFGATVIGSNGVLHHEQAPNTNPVFAYPTPSLHSFTDLDLPPSLVDSHFLARFTGHLPGGAPSETLSTIASGVPAEVLGLVGFTTVQTGFGGVLSVSFSLGLSPSSVDLAYLVFEDSGSDSAIDFTMRPTNRTVTSETLTGFIRIPEPASALLAGVSLVGLGPTYSRTRR